MIVDSIGGHWIVNSFFVLTIKGNLIYHAGSFLVQETQARQRGPNFSRI